MVDLRSLLLSSVLRVLQDLLDLLALLALLDQGEHLECLVYLVMTERRGLLDPLGLRERMVPMVLVARQDPLGRRRL